MIVVADTSPFIGLLKIGHIDVLPQLYGEIIIPDEVATELMSASRPAMVRSFISTMPRWLAVQNPSAIEFIPDIHAGERAAISLARELKADLLLIDEIKGREAAIARSIPTTRTAAVLVKAANAGLLDLESVFEKLRKTYFRVPPKILDELLRRHQDAMRSRSPKRDDI